MLNNITHTTTASTVNAADLELWAETVIDAIRFRSRTDAILSRYEEVDAVLPTTEELKARGADLVAIARALESGLRPGAFRTAVRKGVDLAAFSKALNNGLNLEAFNAAAKHIRFKHFAGMVESLDMETLNAGLEHLVEHKAEERRFPSPIDRVLHRLGDLAIA